MGERPMMKMLSLLLVLIMTVSCLEKKEKGALFLTDKSEETNTFVSNPIVDELERRIRLLEEKDLEWKEIQGEALESFEGIKKIVRKKCYDCHDSDTKLPFYGRPLPSINPVNRHQVEGLEALDMAAKFPLSSKGSNNQLALLAAFRNSVVEKSMPLKSYLLVYPFRRIKKKDQKKLLAWIDPLVERIKGFEEKYAEVIIDPSPQGMAKRVFSGKCFRCHANGISKGGFGGMEDMEALKNSKYVDLDNPTNSELYTISLSQEMPPNKKEALTEEELQTVLTWIQALED